MKLSAVGTTDSLTDLTGRVQRLY